MEQTQLNELLALSEQRNAITAQAQALQLKEDALAQVLIQELTLQYSLLSRANRAALTQALISLALDDELMVLKLDKSVAEYPVATLVLNKNTILHRGA